MSDSIHDVIQVGYGPVSQALALMLGRQGRDVAVIERWRSRYPLPRAVCLDHELNRVLTANGMGETLGAIVVPGTHYEWFNADWERLLDIDWSADSLSGGPLVNFIHQPTLEEALDKAVAAQPSVSLHLGWEVVAVSQHADHGCVELRDLETGERKRLKGRYIVGCDGANSLIRACIGGEREDRGFEADWLVIDVALRDGVTIEALGIPPAGQYCNSVRPTTIVPAGVRDGRVFRRWEFMRLPGESAESLEAEARVWELLAPWVSAEQVELVRFKLYNFRSLIAERWRDSRLLLAGDAAHVMPPFMGQGMCSGLRDAWNLAWKLALVLDGAAHEALLDTYQAERHPHVSQLIDASIYLGKIICITDPAEAAARDQAFISGAAPPPPPFPQLSGGLLRREGRVPAPGAGEYAPHVRVARNGAVGRLDDLVGLGFVLVTTDQDPGLVLDPDTRVALDRLGVRHAPLGAAAGAVQDLDGRLASFLEAHGWGCMLVRPDFYVYGGAPVGGLVDLAKDFLADLAAAQTRPTDSVSPHVEVAA